MPPNSNIERTVKVVHKPHSYEVRMNVTLQWDLLQKAFCKMFNIKSPIRTTYLLKQQRIRIHDDSTLHRFLLETLPEYRLDISLASDDDLIETETPVVPDPPKAKDTPFIHQKPEVPEVSKSMTPMERAFEFKNLCQKYQETFKSNPQLVALNEFFVDQILNGVNIDTDVFEKGLQRHSVLSKANRTYPGITSHPSTYSSLNGEQRWKEKGLFGSSDYPSTSLRSDVSYPGSDMAD